MLDVHAPPLAPIEAACRAAGWGGLACWYEDVPARVFERFARLVVHPPTSAERAPLRLEVDGATARRLVVRLARGNNSDVYLGDDGQVVKVARTPRGVNKLLLQAWIGPRLEAAGVRVARVTALDHDGLWLVQERVTGPSVRDAWRHPSALCPAVAARLLAERARLVAFGEATGLWVDLRDRDLHLGRDGALVHVDYGPRVHMGGHTSYAWLDADGVRHLHDDDAALARVLAADPSAARPT